MRLRGGAARSVGASALCVRGARPRALGARALLLSRGAREVPPTFPRRLETRARLLRHAADVTVTVDAPSDSRDVTLVLHLPTDVPREDIDVTVFTDRVRVRVANALATDGAAWADVVARHNSGTYNNQYMVVDVGAFAAGRRGGDALAPDTLWVVEQIPGTVVAADAK